MVISSFSQNRLLGNDSNYHNPSPQTRRFLAAVVHFTPQSRASSLGPLGGVTGRATAEPGSMSVCLSVCVWAQKLGLSPRVWTREGSLERCQTVRSYRLCHDLALCWNVFSQCVCVCLCVSVHASTYVCVWCKGDLTNVVPRLFQFFVDYFTEWSRVWSTAEGRVHPWYASMHINACVLWSSVHSYMHILPHVSLHACTSLYTCWCFVLRWQDIGKYAEMYSSWRKRCATDAHYSK